MFALLLALFFWPAMFQFSAWVVEKSFTAGYRFGRWLKDFQGTVCL